MSGLSSVLRSSDLIFENYEWQGATVVDQAVSIAPAAESERLASAAAALPHDSSSTEAAVCP